MYRDAHLQSPTERIENICRSSTWPIHNLGKVRDSSSAIYPIEIDHVGGYKIGGSTILAAKVAVRECTTLARRNQVNWRSFRGREEPN